MSRLKVKFYVQLEAVTDRKTGEVTGIKPVGVTVSPSRVKGMPVEIDLEIDSSWFEPLQAKAGPIVVRDPIPSHTTPDPNSLYGRALARANGTAGDE